MKVEKASAGIPAGAFVYGRDLMYLSALKPGQRAEVTELCCPEALKSRLADYGLVPGTQVRCRYQSPARDVSALELRGTVLAVRQQDLGRIRACRK